MMTNISQLKECRGGAAGRKAQKQEGMTCQGLTYISPYSGEWK